MSPKLDNTYVDLAAYLVPDLRLKIGSHRYIVPPPSKDTGLALTVIMTVGAAVFADPTGETLKRLPASQQKILADTEDVDLGELTLGPAYQQMIDDGIPGPHIDKYALYALYYWTSGQDVADAMIALSSGVTDPKGLAPSPSKSGPSTGSGSRKGTSKGSRSTGTTASRKARPSASSPTPPESDGPTSSATGDSSSPTSPPSTE